MKEVLSAVPVSGTTMNSPGSGCPFVVTTSDERATKTLLSDRQLRVNVNVDLSRRENGTNAKFNMDVPIRVPISALVAETLKATGVEATADRSTEVSSTLQLQFTLVVLTLPTRPKSFSDDDGFIRLGVTYCIDTVGASAEDMDRVMSA